jgi:hypothetical protein
MTGRALADSSDGKSRETRGGTVMKSVARIIEIHGGLEALRSKAIRIEPPCSGLMRLCVEHVGMGPRGMPLVSVAHYFEQNGDLMADPDLVFEVNPDSWKSGEWGPVSFTQNSTGTYHEAVVIQNGKVMIAPRLVASLKSFARTWDRNLKAQGYVTAFVKQRKS